MARTHSRRSCRPRPAQGERGSFLLEALIAVLIVALAILGLVGLMAFSIQNVDESKNRSEAAALGTSFIGNMWIDDRSLAALQAKYKAGGAGYVELETLMTQRLPNAQPPVVDIVAGATANSTEVTVTMNWKPPGDAAQHTYTIFGTVGANN
jgi:Tfp pilus assembly protein PilV